MMTLTLLTDIWVAMQTFAYFYNLPSDKVRREQAKATSSYWGNLFSIFSNSDLDLKQRPLGSNPKLPLDISYTNTMFGVIQPEQT